MNKELASPQDGTGGPLKHLRHAVGLDFHVLSTLVFRGWGILAGAATMMLLPLWLTPSQQGYYYTFAALLTLQVFFELGLSQVIVQLVSHEAAHLTVREDGSLYGDPYRVAWLSNLVALLRRWYAVAALLFAVLASGAGWLFFSRNDQTQPIWAWAPVWGVVVALSAINLFLSPQLAVIEGTGQVGQVARLRLFQSIVGYGCLWLLLIVGAQLWVTVAVPMTSVIATLLWLRARGGWLKAAPDATFSISWRRDIFPLQWRIAVSWACGYFIFNLFTPIVFSHHGAVEAGRLGMAMSVFNAVTALGLSWVNAKSPTFTMLISRGESEALNRLFQSVALRSTAATAALGFTVVGMVALATVAGVGAMHRIASPVALFWIACATVINTVVYAAATYMRAHREEPMLPISIVSALTTILVVLLLRGNVSHMMMGNALVGACLSLPWTAWLFHQYRVRHHIAATLPRQDAA